MSQRVSVIRQDQSSCSIIRTTCQLIVSIHYSASVSTIRYANNRLRHVSALSLLLTDTLSNSLLSSTSKVYINPRIVTLTIQLVLLPSSPCAQCELSSGPCIKDIRLGPLHCDSQVCVTCLHTRRVVLQLQARLPTFFIRLF